MVIPTIILPGTGKRIRTLICAFGEHYSTIELYPYFVAMNGFEPMYMAFQTIATCFRNLLSYIAFFLISGRMTHNPICHPPNHLVVRRATIPLPSPSQGDALPIELPTTFYTLHQINGLAAI